MKRTLFLTHTSVLTPTKILWIYATDATLDKILTLAKLYGPTPSTVPTPKLYGLTPPTSNTPKFDRHHL